MRILAASAAMAAATALTTWSSAADWPAWRGAGGQGVCDEKNLPTKWSKTENVKWKVPLAAPGNSTPVISGDRIFLTLANKGGSVRGVRCLARADGKELWKHDVTYDKPERNWNANWYCNASPAVDGKRVVVSYASAGLYCYDLEGKVLWSRTDLGEFQHQFGNGSSPVIWQDLVIYWCGPNEGKGTGRNVLMAVEKETGKTVWENEEKGGSWGTPLIVEIGGKEQLVLGIPNQLKGYDPRTGKELWFCDGLTKLVYTSPLVGEGIAVGMSGYGGSALAVKLGGTGDITAQRLWHHPKNIQRVGSGVITGGHIYILEENGVPHCYNAATGEEVWKVTTRPGNFSSWSSMVLAEGKLYVLTKQGDTLIFKASPAYEAPIVNRLGESTNASIAVSNGELFIRTDKSLWCIAEKPAK